jgi:hypothetical protein
MIGNNRKGLIEDLTSYTHEVQAECETVNIA